MSQTPPPLIIDWTEQRAFLGRSPYVWQVNLASLLAVLFVAFVGFYFSSPFLPLLVRHLGVTDLRAVASLTGVIVAGGALAAALSANAASQLLRRWTHAQVLGVALLASACGSALMGFSQTALQFGVWRVVGLFAGGILTLAYGLGGSVMPVEQRSSAFGVLNSGAMIGSAVGPILGGMLAAVSLRGAFLFNSAIFLVGLLAVWRGLGLRRKIWPR